MVLAISGGVQNIQDLLQVSRASVLKKQTHQVDIPLRLNQKTSRPNRTANRLLMALNTIENVPEASQTCSIETNTLCQDKRLEDCLGEQVVLKGIENRWHNKWCVL